MSHVLVVEDDPINRDILVDNLKQAGYQTMSAENGERAWQLLRSHPDIYCAILLDRMLPDVDGLDVLRRIKAAPYLAHVPVIMQTARAEPADMLEGLRDGAYYYLAKPFQPDTLLAIVGTAVSDYRGYRDMRNKVSQTAHAFGHLTRAEFVFQEPAEARDIAALLANTCSDPQKVVLGLTELMLNAVEHGNLAISYAEKTELIRDGRLLDEIERRLGLGQYMSRQARVAFERGSGELRFTIDDQGQGFAWRDYLEMSPERAFDNHGRGIAMARLLSFDRLDYNEAGNQVVAVVRGCPAAS